MVGKIYINYSLSSINILALKNEDLIFAKSSKLSVIKNENISIVNNLAHELIMVLNNMNIKKVDVYVSGYGSYIKDIIQNSFYKNSLEIYHIYDITPIPHNGRNFPKNPNFVRARIK